ncbi:hypothetical protein NEOLI_005311 [Neolecta irregularis DAH-3]|uniref:Uncharacterized protein n=1 Tax=Neolecta irregularis (strain DAH-3) TaxID=1198029 RepID=A0A1U7LKF4_NEOID|nr:hypothetical protein NEOLI_005311 [Neolecta irregularis DAH-3]|eukprot:OLL23118.1 hypothetical protein NEOLI_005311 [Neolecta irregularis DAH-3]
MAEIEFPELFREGHAKQTVYDKTATNDERGTGGDSVDETTSDKTREVEHCELKGADGDDPLGRFVDEEDLCSVRRADYVSETCFGRRTHTNIYQNKAKTGVEDEKSTEDNDPAVTALCRLAYMHSTSLNRDTQQDCAAGSCRRSQRRRHSRALERPSQT